MIAISDDVLVLTSDGLTGALSDKEIMETVNSAASLGPGLRKPYSLSKVGGRNGQHYVPSYPLYRIPLVPELFSQFAHDWESVMAKLSLTFQERVLREIVPTGGVITIGRQPDNVLCIDNPAVSGHHAKIYWEADCYVVEDMESFNGTYVNNERIAKIGLRDGDVVLIGKHTVHFRAEANEHIPSAWSKVDDRAVRWQRLVEANQPAQLDRTMVLDTKRVREMLRPETLAGVGTDRRADPRHHGRLLCANWRAKNRNPDRSSRPNRSAGVPATEQACRYRKISDGDRTIETLVRS